MTKTSFVGLTWDHPRGRTALQSAQEHATAHDVDLRWEVQPLEGFESAPLDALAERYDLIVMDHPHLGDALATSCVQPMDDVVGADALADIARRTVGPSLASYRLGGSTWALPLDAATQVSARRADLMGDEPRSWADVVAQAERHPVALSLSGPHAYLTFASVCASFGAPLERGAAASIVDTSVGIRAIELLRDLGRRSADGSASQNPIALLDRMTSTDEIAYIPLVFGYVNYAVRRRERAVTYGPAPEGLDGVPGSTIGGTGIAVSARTTVTDGLRRHLLWLLGDEAQRGHIPWHEGQPSARAAWDDAAVNEPVSDFYRRTRLTIDTAWVRPRFAGFAPLQTELSRVLREAVAGTEPAVDVLARLTALQNAAAGRAAVLDAEGVPS